MTKEVLIPGPHREVQKFIDRRTAVSNGEATEVRAIPVERIQNIKGPLLEIANQVKAISRHWNMIEIVSPDQEVLVETKKKFLKDYQAGKAGNPVFEYQRAQEIDVAQARTQLIAVREQLNELKFKARLWRLAKLALYDKILDDLATCDVIEGLQQQNDALVKKGLTKMYRPFEPEVIPYETAVYLETLGEEAQTELSDSEQKKLEDLELTAEEVKAWVEYVLQQYGLNRSTDQTGFEVLVGTNATTDARHRTREKHPTLFIKDEPSSAKRLLSILIAHEIEAHIRQTSNGKALFGLGGIDFSLNDEAWYEGLAERQEANYLRTNFGEPNLSLKLYGRAVELAQQGKSFIEVFEAIYQLSLKRELEAELDAKIDRRKLTKKQKEEALDSAWLTTYRVFRGHTDTSNKEVFAMHKDLGYYYGLQMDKALVASGYGVYNEALVIPRRWLPFLAEIEIKPESLPHPYLNITLQVQQMLLGGMRQPPASA